MQGFDVGQPSEGDVILRPDAGHQNGDLILVGAVEGPIIERGEALHDIDRVFHAIGESAGIEKWS